MTIRRYNPDCPMDSVTCLMSDSCTFLYGPKCKKYFWSYPGQIKLSNQNDEHVNKSGIEIHD